MTDSTAFHPADPATEARPASVRGDLAVMVLTVGLEDSVVRHLEAVVGLAVESVPDADAARDRLASEPPVEVLVTGPGVAPDKVVGLVDHADAAADDDGRPLTSNLVLAGGPQLGRFQELVDRDRLWFVCHAPPPPAEVAQLVAGARLPALRRRMELYGRREVAPPPELVDLARRLSRRTGELADDAELLRRLALQTDTEELALLAAREARERLGGVRAHCLFHDPAEEILWSPWDAAGDDETGDAGMRRESAVAGLASFVLRSGRPLEIARADADPRYDREADDPAGTGTEWVVAVPLPAGSTPLHGPVGVLLVVGEPGSEGSEGLDAASRAWLERLAGTAGPLAADLLERTSAATLALVGANPTARQIFRAEAMDHHVRGVEGRRDVLRLSPSWARWSYWALLAMVLVGLAFASIAEVSTHVTGPAVVGLADDGTARALALLPVDGGGAAAAPGMEAHLDLAGLGSVDGPTRVVTVSPRPLTVEGAAELPAGLGDFFDPAEPVMLVSLDLPPRPRAGRSWREGLRGTAEVELGSEKLLHQLVPALGGGGG